jgi:hypothetical protein
VITARRAIATALVLSGAVLGAATDERAGAFAVGALRRDGVIVPFAAYDGKRWSSPWPPPALELTVPVNLRAVPSRWWGALRGPLDAWQAVLSTPPGSQPRALHVVQPDWVNVHCVRQIGLRTDYASGVEPPPRSVQPYPKDGVAVSPGHAVDAITIVPPTDREAQPLMTALLDPFNRAERLVEQKFGHPVARRRREGVAPTIEAVYAYGEQPRIYYVEASRSYRELGAQPAECAAVAFGTGWFVREGDAVRSLLTKVDLLGCDRAGASYMLPFGVIREGGRLFWLAQFSGWDHERYVVAEIKQKTVDAVLSVWGGGC